MKITVDLDNELEHALQLHLDGGPTMQEYVKAAVRFFRDLYKIEGEGNRAVGYGDTGRFSSYNHIVSPRKYLKSE